MNYRCLGAVLFAGLLVFSMPGCRKKSAGKEKERITRVGLGKLKYRTFRHEIPVQGTVKPVNFATLSSKTAGSLDVLKVDEGDTVKKDTLLFQVDKSNLENQVTVAQRQLEVCENEVKTAEIVKQQSDIQLKKAEQDFNRAVTLKKIRAISLESFEAVEVRIADARCEVNRVAALLKIAVAKLAQQRNNLKIAEKNLDDSMVKAPFSGTITAKHVELNEYVKQGTEIVKIEDPSQLEVECFISSIYYSMIEPGKTPAELSMENIRTEKAVVTYRSPSVDPMSRTFKVKIRLPRNSKLVSGMLCEVKLVLAERKGWGIPAEAIMNRDNGVEAVFICDTKEKRAKLQPVKRGITETAYVELTGGEKWKDATFIVTGQTFINDGDRVVSNKMEK